MLKPILTQLLNHLVNQNSWARVQLQPFTGKAVRFTIPPLSATIIILEDGGLAMAGETPAPEATVSIPFSVALRLLADDEAANTLITLEGDTELASTLAKGLSNLQWEDEEDLSQLIGDVPAHQIGEFGRQALSETKRQTLNVAQMFSEYWQEEQPLIAKKRHVELFLKEVDALREDMERFEKRLEKLLAASKAPLKKKPVKKPTKKPTD
jgi:ubiquinone biosynthesis accessory factor UbiJ